ncbi:MAG: type VI secretion system tube protein Hcp [Burkholderiales bacterium]|nr:type VI secretion system tube protein Hcp [Burkholderiales bacterium]
MATNMFIRIGEIKGESHDSRHKDEIEVVSWAWGLALSAPAGLGGSAAGRASFQDLTFAHLIDRASPSLMLGCASAQRFRDARLTVRRPGTTTPEEFLLVNLEDVIVTSIQTSGAEVAGGLVEQVTLAFARVDFEYRRQMPDGSLDTGVHFKWDLQEDRPG